MANIAKIQLGDGQVLDIEDTYSRTQVSDHSTRLGTIETKLGTVASGAEVNQNAFSNVKVGNTTIEADGETDTLELIAGTNVTLTADATYDKVTITSKDTTYSAATTSAAGLMSAADKTRLNNILSLVYPVGSIYMSVNNTNPGTLFGGTWVAWGSGQVPVGVNASDTSFNTVEKTGGSKNAIIASHTHTATFSGTEVAAHTHTGPSHSHTATFSGTEVAAHTHTGPSHSHTATFSGTAVSGHTHTGPSHTHTTANHTHGLSGTIGEAGSHSHGTGDSSKIRFVISSLTVSNDEASSFMSGSGHAYPYATTVDGNVPIAENPFGTRQSTASAGAHTHTFSGTANSAGAANTSAAGTGATGSAGGHTPAGTVSVASSGTGATGSGGKHTPAGTVAVANGGTGNTGSAGKHTPAGTVSVANTGTSATDANLPPYITCYMWKRTA